MGILDQLVNLLEGFWQSFQNSVAGIVQGANQAILTPIIGTPAPKGSATSGINIAFSQAVNQPWSNLLPGIYWQYVVPLALGLQFIALAFIGLRYQSIPGPVRKKVFRRLFFAFASLFFWLPVASVGTQFFDAIGWGIATGGSSVSPLLTFFTNMVPTSLSNPVLTGIAILIFVYVWFKSLFIFVGRWVAIVLLTLTMPLVGTIWALEVWPLNRFAGLGKKIGGVYPGALAAGIPAAFLMRIGALSSGHWTLSGIFSVFIPLVILWLAAKSQKYMMLQGSQVVVQVAEGARSRALAPVATGATVGAYAVGGAAAGAAVGMARDTVGSGRTPLSVHYLHRSMSGSPSDAGNGQQAQSNGAAADPGLRAARESNWGGQEYTIKSDSRGSGGSPDSTHDAGSHPTTGSRRQPDEVSPGVETSNADDSGTTSDTPSGRPYATNESVISPDEMGSHSEDESSTATETPDRSPPSGSTHSDSTADEDSPDGTSDGEDSNPLDGTIFEGLDEPSDRPVSDESTDEEPTTPPDEDTDSEAADADASPNEPDDSDTDTTDE